MERGHGWHQPNNIGKGGYLSWRERHINAPNQWRAPDHNPFTLPTLQCSAEGATHNVAGGGTEPMPKPDSASTSGPLHVVVGPGFYVLSFLVFGVFVVFGVFWVLLLFSCV